ncbi:MAG: putative actin binding protein [Streblomastix strix]|uniref:Putative actin binding protein n=1 Tax=Streblomastix strix TaxID=222440 RepID=A0A5J4VW86_9EUKA|nr:MAG: putative actin binding protein [Streblomastix strix]
MSRHTISAEEKQAFAEFINQNLIDDIDLRTRLPVDSTSDDIFEVMKDGLIILKMVNQILPGTIDERIFNKTPKNTYQISDNLKLVLEGARRIGCKLVGISEKSIMDGNPMFVFSLLRQLVNQNLTIHITLLDHPELFRLMKENESLDEFRNMSAEQRLLRWFNYHLERSGHTQRVTNFGDDIKDGINYLILLNQLQDQQQQQSISQIISQYQNPLQRAEKILQISKSLGCKIFITAQDIIKGNKVLNQAFIAHLFNTKLGISSNEEIKLSEEQQKIIDEDRMKREQEEENWRQKQEIEKQKQHFVPKKQIQEKIIEQEKEQDVKIEQEKDQEKEQQSNGDKLSERQIDISNEKDDNEDKILNDDEQEGEEQKEYDKLKIEEEIKIKEEEERIIAEEKLRQEEEEIEKLKQIEKEKEIEEERKKIEEEKALIEAEKLKQQEIEKKLEEEAEKHRLEQEKTRIAMEEQMKWIEDQEKRIAEEKMKFELEEKQKREQEILQEEERKRIQLEEEELQEKQRIQQEFDNQDKIREQKEQELAESKNKNKVDFNLVNKRLPSASSIFIRKGQ